MAPSNVDRLFLQAFMTRRVMTEEFSITLFEHCKGVVRELEPNALIEDAWVPFFRNLKDHLDPLGIEVKVTLSQNNGKTIYALVNKVGDELAQLATSYSAVDIQYFKQIVELIITAPNESFSISFMEATREANSLPKGMKMGSMQAEGLLRSLVAKGWLERSSPRHRYSLGVRTLCELDGYLQETFAEEDLQKCDICDGYVFKGYRCPGANGRCEKKIHGHCLDKWLARHRQNAKCTACQEPWSQARMRVVGEGAVRDGMPSGPRHRRRKADRSNTPEDEEGENFDLPQDDEEDDEEGPSQPVKKERKSRAKGRGKGKASQTQATQDEDEDEEQEQNEEEEEDAVMSEEEKPKPRKSRRR